MDPEIATRRLKQFSEMVIHWNRTFSNIMGKNDEGRIVSRHLAESLVPARRMSECGARSWLDFGSGAGFPALPLIVAGVGERWLLVESRRSKTLFLKKAIQELQLVNVEVANARLEKLEPATDGFDGFTSRATEGLALTLDLAARHLGQEGRAFLWRGGSWSSEASEGAEWRGTWEVVGVTKLPEALSEVVEFQRLQGR